mgnify:CR=1 FL=1
MMQISNMKKAALAFAAAGLMASASAHADSLLLHGDNAGAVATARAIRDGLTQAGVTIAPMADVLADKG